jgi:hypothetical protein
MRIIFIILGVVVLFCGVFVFLFSGSSATRRTMRTAYLTAALWHKEHKTNISEHDLLCEVLKGRPPFSGYPDTEIHRIVNQHPNIKSLTEFVVQFDKEKWGL